MPHRWFGSSRGDFSNARILSEVGSRWRRGWGRGLKSGEFWPKRCRRWIETADPSTARRDRSASLGMTKEGLEFPVGIACWDPRSQKRDLGHPSIEADAVHWAVGILSAQGG